MSLPPTYQKSVEIPSINEPSSGYTTSVEPIPISVPVALPNIDDPNNGYSNNDYPIEAKPLPVDTSISNIPMATYSQAIPAYPINQYSNHIPITSQEMNTMNQPAMAIPVSIPDAPQITNAIPTVNTSSLQQFLHYNATNYESFDIYLETADLCSGNYVWTIYGISNLKNQRNLIMNGYERCNTCTRTNILTISTLQKEILFTNTMTGEIGCCERFGELKSNDYSIDALITQTGCCCCVLIEASLKLKEPILKAKHNCCKQFTLPVFSTTSQDVFSLFCHPLINGNYRKLHITLSTTPSMTSTQLAICIGIAQMFADIIRTQGK